VASAPGPSPRRGCTSGGGGCEGVTARRVESLSYGALRREDSLSRRRASPPPRVGAQLSASLGSGERRSLRRGYLHQYERPGSVGGGGASGGDIWAKMKGGRVSIIAAKGCVRVGGTIHAAARHCGKWAVKIVKAFFRKVGAVDAFPPVRLAFAGLKQVRSGRLTRPPPQGGSFRRFGDGPRLSGCLA